MEAFGLEISTGYLCFGLFFVLHVVLLFFLLIGNGFGRLELVFYFFYCAGFYCTGILYEGPVRFYMKGELDFGKRQFELCIRNFGI